MLITLLEKMLQPAIDQMPPEFAQRLLDLRANPDMQARIDHLRTKASSGAISGDEEAQYKEFVKALDIISLLQSKARKILSAKQ